MSEAQVLEAVKALHDVGTDDEQRTAVSNYLSSFQRSLLSWNVSMNLLSRPGALDSQLFAAQTLKEKLRGHSWQLSHDSWQPVRSCIVSVLQRPCEPALEVQVSLCLVALIILTSSDDVISQLRQALPPSRTLLVLQLLGEEVGSDTSPYEPAPGMDKVDWWLQARRAVGNMAPMVLPFINECISQPSGAAMSDSHAVNQPPGVDSSRRLLLQRSLACASAWFRLGVLFTLPSAAFEGILDVALKTCQENDKSIVAAACETLAEAFERCPDALLVQLQPHLLELSSVAIGPREAVPDGHDLQQLLVALFVVYVQSCADSIAGGGRSDALRALFAVSHVAKGVREDGVLDTDPHEFMAAHAVDAVATVGRALLKAVEDEGRLAPGSSTARAAVSAQLQGMVQVYLEGVVGLLPLHQAALEASIGAGYSSQGTEVVHEAYTLAAQLVGPAAFTEAMSAHSATTSGACARPRSLAAMLRAIVAVLFGNDDETERDGNESDGAAGTAGGRDASQRHVAAGLLELVQQCTAEAQSADTPGPTRAAVLGSLFTATRAIAQTLDGATRDAFAETLLQIAACAQHVLRQEPLPQAADGAPCGDAAMVHAPGSAGGRGSMDAAGIGPGMSLLPQASAGVDGSGPAVRASSAIVHVMRALRGTPSEVQLVTETLALLQQVPLWPQCDTALLCAVFTASAEATAAAAADGDAAQEGLRMVAGQLTVQVAEDVKAAVAAAGGALHAAGVAKGADRETCMDVHSAAAGTDLQGHDDAVSASLGKLTRHVHRAAALLQASQRGSGDREGEDGGPVAAAARTLLPMLAEAAPALTAALSAEGAVRPACMSRLRQAWGQVIAAAVQLDAVAAVGLASTVFDVIAARASVDALVDWQQALAVMIDRYLPRDRGHAPTADRVLLTLQKIWALPELQALPCPGEADMIPEASIASSVLCSHVARSALTPTSWLSTESVVPLIEAGTARCAMSASANLKHVAAAALTALLNMLSASAGLPVSSMSPLAGCILRGGGTMMMGFACALTAPGASHRVLKLTQLLLQLTVVVARAVPLVAAPPLVSLPQVPVMPLPGGAGFHAHPSIHPRTLTATSVASGVSYVILWLKHALSCLRPGMLHSHTPDSICSAWQPLLAQAILAGLQIPPPAGGGAGGSQPFNSAGNTPMDTSPGIGLAPGGSQPAVLASSASPFLGLPAAGQLSAHPGVVTWGGLGAGMRFGSALRADIPFAAQLSPHMSSAAVFADQQAAAPTPEAFNMSDTLASAPCRALKKAIRAVVASLAAPPPPAAPLSNGLSSFPFTPFSDGPLATAAPAAPQHVFQPALCLTGNAFTAQHAFPAVPLNAGNPVLLPHVLTPTPVHLPLNPHIMHPVAVANGAAPPLSGPPFFAASAAPAAFFNPSFSVPTGVSPALPAVMSTALGGPHDQLGMVSHAPGIAHMQAQALGLSPPGAPVVSGGHGMHAASLAMHMMPAGTSMGMSDVRLPRVMGSLEQSMEAVMIGANGSAQRLSSGLPTQKAEDRGRPM